MDVLSIGALRLDTLSKPGRGWSENSEVLTLGVRDDAWVAESLRINGSPLLEALVANQQDTLAPRKLCTLLSAESLATKPAAAYASVEHVFELVLVDTWVPELARQLAAPYTVVGQVLPRWRLRFQWDMAAAAYHKKEWLFEFDQINALKVTRAK